MAVNQYNSGTVYQNGVALAPPNPSVISASYANGTAVTGTLLETVSQSLLVPANTFTDGMLEVICRMTKTGTAGTSSIKVYKNTSNTLTGATLIGNFALTSSATFLFTQGIRTFRINSNILTGFATSISLTDYVTTNTPTTTTFTTNVDNYILFTLTLGNIADSANVSMARLTQYK